ncbi:MAG: SUMF1/EgtB/PvdO family nonheme iron enzyme [Deltaproteobacteria bacterium]|nr:SUMF1/EgtB/PvdO family nonheme iron enzyme [Deltaproteobacteria bacterium]
MTTRCARLRGALVVGVLALAGACGARPALEVVVPPAEVTLGCRPERDAACADEPPRTVRIAPFGIDRTEVTVLAYAACVDAGRCAAPTPSCAGTWSSARRDLPITCVDLDDARRFCAWRGARVPTEDEWEYAARGADGRTYPWGDEAPSCATVALPQCGAVPDLVGTHAVGASPFGALDMAGNVSEWTVTPVAASDPRYVVVKDYGLDTWHMRASQRLPVRETYREGGLGFRCVRSQ